MQANLSSDSRPPAKLQPVGLAFTISNLNPRQHHVGIIALDAEGWKLIHQTGESSTYTVEPAPGQFYVWVDFSHKVESLLRDNLAGLCFLMAKRHRENVLPFGYSDFRGWVSSTGEIADADGRGGLTCAGFVLGILDTCHIDWLKTDTWPDPATGEDVAWQRSLAPRVARGEASRLETLLHEVGNKRYKPEQVGGAGLAAAMPCDRAMADEAGALVVERALTLRPQPSGGA